eukprot:NODE_182_length_13754_cov_0.678067.p12 type:complete len:130 gc:universal NODE_182_length_13754_cov_0.678067:7876-7487(-)
MIYLTLLFAIPQMNNQNEDGDIHSSIGLAADQPDTFTDGLPSDGKGETVDSKDSALSGLGESDNSLAGGLGSGNLTDTSTNWNSTVDPLKDSAITEPSADPQEPSTDTSADSNDPDLNDSGDDNNQGSS